MGATPGKSPKRRPGTAGRPKLLSRRTSSGKSATSLPDYSPPVSPALLRHLFPTHPALGDLCNGMETSIRVAWREGKSQAFVHLAPTKELELKLCFMNVVGEVEKKMPLRSNPLARFIGENKELWDDPQNKKGDVNLQLLLAAMNVSARGDTRRDRDYGVLVKADVDDQARVKYIYGSLFGCTFKRRPADGGKSKMGFPAGAEPAGLAFFVGAPGDFTTRQEWLFPACLARKGYRQNNAETGYDTRYGVNEQNERFVDWWNGLPPSIRDAGVPVLFSLDVARNPIRVVAMLHMFY